MRHWFFQSVACAALLSLAGAQGQNHSAPASVRQTVPTEFLGGYIWGFIPNSDNPVSFADQKLSGIGMTGVRRIVIAPSRWNPLGRTSAEGGIPTLEEAVLWPENEQVFRSNRVVVVTVYPNSFFHDGIALYRRPASELPDDKWESVRATAWLELWTAMWRVRKTFPDTQVIWTNWELDNDLVDIGWERGLQIQQDRVSVAADVRAAAAEYDLAGEGDVLVGVEFNHVRAGYVPLYWDPTWGPVPEPRKFSGFRAALSLRGDFYLGYSVWESIFHTRDPGFDHTSPIKEKLAEIRQGCVDAGWGSLEPSEPICGGKFFIGEFGYLRDWDDEESTILGRIARTAYDEGAVFAINWVGFDQPSEMIRITNPDGSEGVIDQSQFGVFDASGNATARADVIRGWLLNGLPPILAPNETPLATKARMANSAKSGVTAAPFQVRPPRIIP